MSIRIKRLGFILLLVVGIIEALIFPNGAVVSLSTVGGISLLFSVLHLFGIRIGKEELSAYIKDLSINEKILAVLSLIVMVMWIVIVAVKL